VERGVSGASSYVKFRFKRESLEGLLLDAAELA
jgi:hypothetical protein